MYYCNVRQEKSSCKISLGDYLKKEANTEVKTANHFTHETPDAQTRHSCDKYELN